MQPADTVAPPPAAAAATPAPPPPSPTPTPPAGAVPVSGAAERIFASPLARKMAADKGVSLQVQLLVHVYIVRLIPRCPNHVTWECGL